MRRITKVLLLFTAILGITTLSWADWKTQTVRQLNGRATEIKLPAKHQILTESWNRVVAVPYIVYMPEKDRVLMLVSCNYPHQAMVLWSDDHGATWSQPKYVHTDAAGKPDTGIGVSLTYLGKGRAVLVDGEGLHLWFSNDYGETWGDKRPLPPVPTGKPFYMWDPFFVDRDPSTGKVVRLVETGYMEGPDGWEAGGSSQGLIRFSTDEGQTWSESTLVPEWRWSNEIVLTRAKNGDLVAACRNDGPRKFRKNNLDHFSGVGISISKDNGSTWSKVNLLYDWGRMHPSLVVLANGDIVMTYVVRLGYPRTPEGYPQYGIEAVVSHDNGQTWDLDHRYILETWKGIRTGPNSWYASSQATSTVLLPDGSLLTAFGTGYRSLDPSRKGRPGPRDVGLVLWNVNKGPLNSDRAMASASFDSDLRNKFDPDPRLTKHSPAGRRNIALAERGAQVRASASDEDPSFVLYDPYLRKILNLETVPAWVEISWPKAHKIDEIRIHPGAPEFARAASTECVPLDYQLQYQKDGQWVDLVPPVSGAKRYKDFDPQERAFLIEDDEFYYAHKFVPVSVKAIRLYITRTSDTGKRGRKGDSQLAPEAKRETSLRLLEVFEAKP